MIGTAEIYNQPAHGKVYEAWFEDNHYFNCKIFFIQYSTISRITSFHFICPRISIKTIENAFNIDFNTIFAVTFRTAIVTLLIVFVIK